ncbi:hypothetical protein M514_22394, partial [Trichuris suis]
MSSVGGCARARARASSTVHGFEYRRHAPLAFYRKQWTKRGAPRVLRVNGHRPCCQCRQTKRRLAIANYGVVLLPLLLYEGHGSMVIDEFYIGQPMTVVAAVAAVESRSMLALGFEPMDSDQSVPSIEH